ncbi:MAG TPA: class I SAM-dependent methyltransferase [Nocardioides sp.]|jgi:ubiquinone/menaquinone biosynthesis C-methylase UbiE|nr:class I SAM-dependent methyltransferase [Nocardioides sp.]
MTTTRTEPSALEDLKVKQQKIWSSGDYGRIAWITVPLAHELAEAVELRPGASVLDVACGTGHVALEAARTLCEVTGVDYVPELIEVARRRAEAEALEADFRVGDAEALPFADGSFDFVLSAIGVMFTADHDRAASELVRTCRPGGRIGLASWTPTGFVGRLLKTVGKHVPPPPAAQPPTRWGTEEVVAELLGDGVHDVASYTASVTQRFASPEAFADFFLTHYGPTYAAASRLDDTGRTALRDDMVRLAHEANRALDGTFVSDWDYLVVTAEKR